MCKIALWFMSAACLAMSLPLSADNGDLRDAEEPTAVYEVLADDLSLFWLEGAHTVRADSDLWAAIVALLPNDILKEEVIVYQVFSDGRDGTLAYVSQLEEPLGKWLFALDPADAKNRQGKEFVTTVTHEFAHILALNEARISPGIAHAACGQDFWVDEGCPNPDAEILSYFNRFWKGARYAEHQRLVAGLDGLDREAAIADFYTDHFDEFINEYSATDPVEDFAETFSYFVFTDKIHQPEQIREHKINYFYSVPKFVAIRDHIRARTAVRRASIDDQYF